MKFPDDYSDFIARTAENEYARRNGGKYWENRVPGGGYKSDFLQLVDDLYNQYGPGPHDIFGRTIEVGRTVAVGLASHSSSNLIIIEVTEIPAGNEWHDKIKGKIVQRNFDKKDDGKHVTYQDCSRMVVLK